MIIEALVEAIIPFLGRLLSAIFIDFFLHMVCYTTGFGVLKVLTLGKYPPNFASPFGDSNQEIYVMATGGVFWFVMLLVWIMT